MVLIPNSFSIETWGEIFKHFRQVKHVRINSSAESLDVTISNRDDVFQFAREQLDDTLYKHNGNPMEVAKYYLKKHGVIVVYQNTLVAFFDIIGYSSYIDQTNIEESIIKISKFIENVKMSAGTDILAVKIDNWILSDSVIIVVDTNRHPLFSGSIEHFLATCSMILEDGMRNKLPLRGAIGGGDFYKDGEVMVSSALVDAARYEKEQEWLGAVLTPNALQIIDKAKDFEIELKGETEIDLFSDKFKHYVRYGTIPWKQKISDLISISDKSYYIKPFGMAEEDWAAKNLPDYFNDSLKIDNSHCLYGHN